MLLSQHKKVSSILIFVQLSEIIKYTTLIRPLQHKNDFIANRIRVQVICKMRNHVSKTYLSAKFSVLHVTCSDYLAPAVYFE